MDLTQKKCVACEGDVAPLNAVEAEVLKKQLKPGWTVSPDSKSLHRDFVFKNWAEAFAFVQNLSFIAESEGHHPDITLSWGKVGVDLTTHAIKGLSENDFIVAAKIDLL